MIKLDSSLMNQLGANSLNKNKVLDQSRADVSENKGLNTVTLQFSQSDVKSFSMFHRTVHRRLDEALPSRFQELQNELAEQEIAEREERADLAAGNILGFIEHRLKQDVADGATQEQLTSRMEAALKGFEKGYSEASDILKDLNMLSAPVEEDISLTKDKVLAGLDALREQYLGTGSVVENEEVSVTNSKDSSIVEPKTESKPLSRHQIGAQLTDYAYEQAQVGRANEFSFELQTKDGDMVTINASSILALQAESGSGRLDGKEGSHEFAYQSMSGYRESNFAFTVEGELDDDELKAINDILNNVNDLAVDFYQGDVSKAFDKAMSLGFDNSEINGFAFSMTQVTSIRAMQAYQPEQAILKPNVMAELKPIGRFASELSKSLTMVNDAFAHPRELLTSLTEQFNQMNKPLEFPAEKLDFAEFTKSLIDKYTALPPTE